MISFLLTSSPFSSESNHVLGQVHGKSQWLGDVVGGTFDPPLYDSGRITDLITHTTPPLDSGISWAFVVIHFDGLELASDPSPPSSTEINSWIEETPWTDSGNWSDCE